jgi:hypothetical protein
MKLTAETQSYEEKGDIGRNKASQLEKPQRHGDTEECRHGTQEVGMESPHPKSLRNPFSDETQN